MIDIQSVSSRHLSSIVSQVWIKVLLLRGRYSLRERGLGAKPGPNRGMRVIFQISDRPLNTLSHQNPHRALMFVLELLPALGYRTGSIFVIYTGPKILNMAWEAANVECGTRPTWTFLQWEEEASSRRPSWTTLPWHIILENTRMDGEYHRKRKWCRNQSHSCQQRTIF